MKKHPKLILRESCIADVSASWPPGRFVEMGAGTGYMTRLFLERGFTGACHDLGEDSRQMIRGNLGFAGERIRVVDDLAELEPASFDYLLAFEVLEHIDNDHDVLRGWMRYLKPGGRILVSVPAHQRKYGKSDEIVGHVRRYEKDALRELLEYAGVGGIRIVNYGFPVTEATRRLSNWMIRNDRSYEDLTPQQRSIRSAQAKPKIINRMLAPVSDQLFAPFNVMQRWFYRRDWGDGFVACGVKRDDA
ncbi:MAG: class I SAM-dependent methyltransferase [Proteobacteria bacterium]|nr:class I SAM-dependent methyltransferase [Pseudomonadota bacterium]